MNRILLEKKTIYEMIRIFCRKRHDTAGNLCNDCSALYEYALRRLNECRYKADKPVCKKCRTHCYRKDNREKIRIIMRYAGPKMIYRHPILALRHIVHSFR